MIARNEKHRYLDAAIAHLASYCDAIVILDDGSDDGTDILDYGLTMRPNGECSIYAARVETPEFYAHEGRARQKLLELTLDLRPTHVLAIDADEFVADPAKLRATIEEDDGRGVAAYGLCMQEIWQAADTLKVRMDGGWGPHEVACLWKVPDALVGPGWHIRDVALACGRVPAAVEQAAARRNGRSTNTEILHFGWAREHERQERYARYAEHDGGRYHNSRHLDSIMWADDRVQLCEQEWPAALIPYQEKIRS
jgi:glycosyltransferase involved in cell wall biosynthesis